MICKILGGTVQWPLPPLQLRQPWIHVAQNWLESLVTNSLQLFPISFGSALQNKGSLSIIFSVFFAQRTIVSSQLCSYAMHRRFPPQPLLPGLAEHKGAVGIRPNHLLAATLTLFLLGGGGDRFQIFPTMVIGMSQPTFKLFWRACDLFDLASSGLGVVSHMTKFFMNHPWQDYVKILISHL